MEEEWDGEVFVAASNDRPFRLTFDDALRYLVNTQVLIRDTASTNNAADECFALWLPNWGLVLKSWHEARLQLMGVVARAQGGEISERNLLNKNRHASISTPFLLDELKQQGMVQIVERPFGRFVKRVTNK